MVNNIKNNTISKISAKEGLNVLKQTKNAEIIKDKIRTPGQKELLNLFNNLSDIILTDKTRKDKTLMSSKDEKEKEKEKEMENEDENKNMSLEYMEDVDDKLFKE